MKNCKLILFSILSVCFLTHCQNSTGGGDSTAIPSVSITCSNSNCSSASGSKKLFVYITTSGCMDIGYGQVATGNGTVDCSGGVCTSDSITWSDSSGAITSLPSNSYDFCSVIDITGTYAGNVPAGDSTSSKSTVFIGSEANPVSSISITNWINGAFVN